MNKVIQMFRNHKQQKELQEQQKQERFLKKYFSVVYRINDYDKIEIPYFMKAQQTVDDLKKRGLLKDVYKYIIKKGGVKVAC